MLHLVALAIALSPAMSWRQIGPAIAGGRVSAVAGTDRDPLLYYFGAAGAGVFKTSDGGLVWEDVWPARAAAAIGAVAIAPGNPNVVWVGTGESAPRNDASYGDGMWRTTDGGRTWHHIGLPSSYAISRILIDPRNAAAAVVGVLGNPFKDSADRGVYRTSDGGRSWHHTLYAGPQSGISDMAMDPRHPNVMYAGVWQFRRKPWTFTSGGRVDGLYRSIDAGRTWSKLQGHGLPAGTLGRIGITVAPGGRRVYALIQSTSGVLWRSDDAGQRWRMMSADTLIDQRPFYMSRLAVDPSNPDQVWFASENLIVTSDGGRTYRDVHQALHQDHHDFWISHNGRRLIEADDGGAPISIDHGRRWDWRFNVVLAQTYHIGYDLQQPYHVCGGFQDNDSFCGPAHSLSPLGILNSDWRDVANNSDGVWVWPQPGNADEIWNVGINELNGQLGIFDVRSRQNYDITPSVADTNGRGLAGLPYRFNWEAPLMFSTRRPSVAYFGANVVFATSDNGRTWQTISPDLTRNDPSKQQAAGGPINTDVSGAEFYDTLLDIAPSPIDADTLWAGSDDGLVHVTFDGGAHWMNATPPAPPWGRVETIEPSAFSTRRAYAVVNRHLLGDREPYVFVTNDAGKTWRRIDAGLPRDEYAHVVREDPLNPSVLYAGLEQGVWFSSDGGADWQSLKLNMPAVAVRDLRIHPREHDLIAGTHGRGLWILDDLTPLEHLAQTQRATQAVLLPVRTARTWYIWWWNGYGTHDDECCAAADQFSGADPPYGALITYYLPKPVSQATVRISDAAGRVIRTLSAAGTAGFHRMSWDLGVEPPVSWHATGDWNQGPNSGATVVPGAYAATLTAGSALSRETVNVQADPRAPWSQSQYVDRYNFIQQLNDELSAIDAALNRMDAWRAHAPPRVQSEIFGVYRMFTSGVRNSEDDMFVPDRLRERLTILQGDIALSQGPPLSAHVREAASIHAEYQRAMIAYHRLLSTHGLFASEDTP